VAITFSFSALVVVGNEGGVVGHGLSTVRLRKEFKEAIAKGIEDAKKNDQGSGYAWHFIPSRSARKDGAAKVLIHICTWYQYVIAGG